jgi:UDP-GlcNAc:undecaprenyl-phosphate GlcNAc-1-phosphate transferase
MGDCGSMFVGFLLSTSVLLNQTGGRSRGIVPILAVPVLILFVPIFDTTFVTILRKMWGRRASQGGRDHTSHRLVALGMTERNAVLMLYMFAVGAGILAIFISRLDTVQSLALICVFTIALAIAGVYLSKVKVYSEPQEQIGQSNAIFAFIVDVSYKRRIFEVFLDAFLITLSYYTSYLLLFGTFERSTNWDLFLKSVPLLIIVKLAAFLVVGVYRGLWRYTSIGDFITFTKAVFLGSILSVLGVLLLYRFDGFSRAVFIVDGIILLLAISGSRMAFRIFRQMLPSGVASDGCRVLIYGAGDGGEMVLRELRNNAEWQYRPVGFIDDDPLKKDKVIHGLRVYDANGSLPEVCRRQEISEILVSFREIDPEKLAHIRETCRDLNISLKRAQLKIESLDFE